MTDYSKFIKKSSPNILVDKLKKRRTDAMAMDVAAKQFEKIAGKENVKFESKKYTPLTEEQKEAIKKLRKMK